MQDKVLKDNIPFSAGGLATLRPISAKSGSSAIQ